MIKNCFRLVSPLLPTTTTRIMSSASNSSSFALMFSQYGDEFEVVKKVDTSEKVSINSQLEPNQVLVKFLASTINPSDIMTIRGRYSREPKFPAVIGNEGVAEVIKAGPEVNKLKIGDWVIPAVGAFGTWRTHAIAPENHLLAIDKEMGLYTAAQTIVNPPTAYLLLKDYVQLKPGDSVLQNGANSAVGLLVIQLCREWGFKSINVVRARPDPKEMEKLVNQLRELGADHVVTEEDLKNDEVMDKIWAAGTPKPILSLDCINGDNASACMRHMADQGTMVTYGAMSGQPLTVPPGPVIFKQLKFVGFWLSLWHKNHANSPKRAEMVQELSRLFKEGKLKAPKVIPIKMENYKEALEKATKTFIEGKVVMIN